MRQTTYGEAVGRLKLERISRILVRLVPSHRFVTVPGISSR